MARPLSDAEMAQLEAAHSEQQKPRPLSDEEMASLEAQHATASQESPEARRSRIMSEINQQIDNTDYAAAMNNALGVMTGGGLARAVPKAAGILGSAAEGALSGAAQAKPGERGTGAALGGAVQGGGSALAKLLGKAGDVGMQVAVGRKKYTPGVGTELADQGIMGTQRGMQKQVANRLGVTGEEMQRIASEIPEIDARAIGNEMSGELTGPLTGQGAIRPSARDVGTVNDMRAFADDIASRGQETGAQALARRKAAGASAYSAKTADPKLSPLAQASKLEQQKYSQALKAADPRMVPVDATYAALKKAEKSLGEEPALPKSLMGLLSAGPKNIPGGALATSAVSQGAVKGGKLAEWLAPLLRQAAVNRTEK
jgi:hypothetical protein